MIAPVMSTTPLRFPAPRPAARPDGFQPSGGPDFVPPTRAQLLRAVAPSFPDSWSGRWRGTLTVSNGPEVGVELEITPRPDGRTGWSLRYQGQPERAYELVPVDPARGHYLVDEKNGILLDSYYEDGVLLSQFEVGQNRVTARYQRQGDRLLLEMNMFGKEPVRASAMGVRAFGLGSLQRAILTKQ